MWTLQFNAWYIVIPRNVVFVTVEIVGSAVFCQIFRCQSQFLGFVFTVLLIFILGFVSDLLTLLHHYLRVLCGCSLLLGLCGLCLSSLMSVLCTRGVSRGNYYGSIFNLVYCYMDAAYVHVARQVLPRAALKARRTPLRVSGGARCVTYRQPDHSSGFVMKGQCGAAAVACVFRVQSITLRDAGRMPKMGLLRSLKKAFCSSGCRLDAVKCIKM